MINANVGDIRVTEDGGVIHVRGKGNKDRRIPIERSLVEVIASYLDSRAMRFPATTKRRSDASGLAAWPAEAPLFVGRGGERISRGTLRTGYCGPLRRRAWTATAPRACWSMG